MAYKCDVCPRGCVIEPGETGFCRARGVFSGSAEVMPLNYGKVTSIGLDPVEKKPLWHFYPGKMILSVGSFGCNLRCPWCQNHRISMAGAGEAEFTEVTPLGLADLASGEVVKKNIGVAFTYNEPLVGFEFVLDTARILKERGLKAVLVTNGYANPGKFLELLPFIDAMNIDLKGVREEFYRRIGGDLSTVKENIRAAAGSCHVELTYLLVPGENDSEEEMREAAGFVRSVSAEIPLHISRFFPRFEMQGRAATDAERMYLFRDIALRELKYVHLGNV